MGCGSQFQSYIVSSHFSIKMLFGSSLSPVVCMSAYVLSVLFVLLCIVVSYMTCLYELHGKCVIRDRNCLPFVVHPGFTSSYLRGPCCSPESDYFFFLHQNQNIFFSNIRNQNIFLEENHTPPPPFQVKWSFPYCQTLSDNVVSSIPRHEWGSN